MGPLNEERKLRAIQQILPRDVLAFNQELVNVTAMTLMLWLTLA